MEKFINPSSKIRNCRLKLYYPWNSQLDCQIKTIPNYRLKFYYTWNSLSTCQIKTVPNRRLKLRFLLTEIY